LRHCIALRTTSKGEGKQFFFEKRTKKLLFIGTRGGANVRPNLQKFLLLFSKRSAFFLMRAGMT
jgi:hypothetical protein